MAETNPTGIICPCSLNDKRTTLVVDSACDISCITPTAVKLLDLEIIPKVQNFLSAGSPVTSLGYVVVKDFRVGQHHLHSVKLPVCNLESVCAPASGLLGLDLFPNLGISIHGVPVNYPRENVEEEIFNDHLIDHSGDWLAKHAAPQAERDVLFARVQDLLDANADIPIDSFCTHPAARIILETGNAKPVYVSQYRLSEFMSKFVDKQIAKWDINGVITDAPADSPWNFPLLAALSRTAKLQGKDPRICIDPRLLNLLLPDDPRPIPTVDRIHARLRGFTYISEIDLTKAFNQCQIAEDDRIKTTFTWKGRKRMFNGAPFGLKPLSQMFQGLIEQVLTGCRDYATPFIDNIYVHTNGSMEEHAGHVRHILSLLNKYKLRVNLEKTYLGYTAVNVLGHLVSGTTKQVDPTKISSLLEWPTPKTGKDIESFLGFTNYLREYVPCYAKIAYPLEKLRKVKILGQLWTDDCQTSFDTFCEVLSKAPILNTPLENVPFCLQTDASQRGVGWCLYQIDPETGKNRYILFGAKALQKAQVNYGATRRELLAIVIAIQACRHWIYGTKFTLYTDHQALTYLFTQKHMNYMMLDWLDFLLDYNFLIVHRPGILMVLPDALSRMYSSAMGGGDPKDPKILSLASVELTSHPDKELKDFINQRFDKKFLEPHHQAAFLEQIHSKGHFGAEELFSAIWNQGIYWPGLRQDCNKQVNSCLQCLRFNIGKTGYHPRQFIDANLPFEHIAVDTLTGFPTTERGNNVILVISDICTRYKLFFPQQTKSAAETARTLWYCMCTFPLPKIIQSDNGTEFCNQIVKQLSELTGIDHRTIASYNPRANGTAENAVGNCEQILRKKVAGVLQDWDYQLPGCQLAINTKLNAATNTSPASLLFGMNVNAFANYDRATSKLLTVHQLLERNKVIQELVRPTVNGKFRTAQKKRTEKANSRTHNFKDNLKPGTLVMVKDPTRSTKHQPRWFGPFRVIRQKKGGTYVLQNADSSIYFREPPIQHLKIIDGNAEVGFDETFYVERVLDHRGTPAKRMFLIKWLNYPASHNTWEPTKNLDGCERMLTEYWDTRKAMK